MTLIKNIELLRPINSGRYGTVYKGFDHTCGQFRAVKVLPLKRHDVDDNKNQRMIENEISNMRRLNGCPNIVSLVDVECDNENMYMIQEYCGGSTLHEMMISKTLSNADRVTALKNVTAAINACHNKGIIYADLKPSNIISVLDVSPNIEFKLIDFGASVDTQSSNASINMATPLFAAPELFSEGHASFPFDVWSLGVLAYMLMCNEHPFFKNNQFTVRMFQQPLVFSDDFQCQDARDFIEKALQKDPGKRPKTHELLAHPFLDVRQILK